MVDITAYLMEDVDTLFTLSFRDIGAAHELVENICMNISVHERYDDYATQQAQVFWCYARNAAIDTYLEFSESTDG